MNRVMVCLALGVLAACSSGADTAPTTEPASFIVDRDAICQAASADIEAINDEKVDPEGAPTAEQVAGLREVMARIELVQQELDGLTAPAYLEVFVREDAARRAERITLVGELIEAIEQGDADAVEATDVALTENNLVSEGAEDFFGLSHCA